MNSFDVKCRREERGGGGGGESGQMQGCIHSKYYARCWRVSYCLDVTACVCLCVCACEENKSLCIVACSFC